MPLKPSIISIRFERHEFFNTKILDIDTPYSRMSLLCNRSGYMYITPSICLEAVMALAPDSLFNTITNSNKNDEFELSYNGTSFSMNYYPPQYQTDFGTLNADV